MKRIDLTMLHNGVTGLSPRYGGFLWEGAAVCFKENGHNSDVRLSGEGHFPHTYEIACGPLHPDAGGSFGDLQEATEFGAMGIALAVISSETGLRARRSHKGTGFDFWLGTDDGGLAFNNKARLEVSGILKEKTNEAPARLQEKLHQTARSSNIGLPAYAAVVEFGIPKILIGQR